MTETIKRLITRYEEYTNLFQIGFVPFLLLFCRLWVAWVFFNSGLIKITSWESTLYLFELEYQVPLLPWELAAYIGTASELILPTFIALGILPGLWPHCYLYLTSSQSFPTRCCGRKVFMIISYGD